MPRNRHDSAGSAASMRFGVTIPNDWGIADRRQVLAMGPLAEALGYDSVWVMDHLLNSGYIRERLYDARWRPDVVAYRCTERDRATDPRAGGAGAPRPRYWTWALLMRRAFDLDVLRCPGCARRM